MCSLTEEVLALPFQHTCGRGLSASMTVSLGRGLPLICNCGITVSFRDHKLSFVPEFIVELGECLLHISTLVLNSLCRDVLILAKFFKLAELGPS